MVVLVREGVGTFDEGVQVGAVAAGDHSTELGLGERVRQEGRAGEHRGLRSVVTVSEVTRSERLAIGLGGRECSVPEPERQQARGNQSVPPTSWPGWTRPTRFSNFTAPHSDPFTLVSTQAEDAPLAMRLGAGRRFAQLGDGTTLPASLGKVDCLHPMEQHRASQAAHPGRP